MSMDTGGQAFPKTGAYNEGVDSEFDSKDVDGMTWLDNAAIQIAAGVADRDGIDDDDGRWVIAGNAYDLAEALLAEKRRREK